MGGYVRRRSTWRDARWSAKMGGEEMVVRDEPRRGANVRMARDSYSEGDRHSRARKYSHQ